LSGSISAVAQQINTNYVVHICAHLGRSIHHMRHHAAPTRANFGSECSLWDILFQTYDGFTMGFNLRLQSDPFPGWTSAKVEKR
jgi:sterol desaturase/sphingolipid hydroxylase (fatty acid hydroxylase superfamily)